MFWLNSVLVGSHCVFWLAHTVCFGSSNCVLVGSHCVFWRRRSHSVLVGSDCLFWLVKLCVLVGSHCVFCLNFVLVAMLTLCALVKLCFGWLTLCVLVCSKCVEPRGQTVFWLAHIVCFGGNAHTLFWLAQTVCFEWSNRVLVGSHCVVCFNFVLVVTLTLCVLVKLCFGGLTLCVLVKLCFGGNAHTVCFS